MAVKLGIKSIPIIPIMRKDILSFMHGGESIELSQKFLKGLIDSLPKRGEKTDIGCYFCKKTYLILGGKPYGGLSEGLYVFRCPKCSAKFWVAMI